MKKDTKHNFGAGPCILPQEVLNEAAEAVKNWNNTGLSILEISHRTEGFAEIVQKAKALIRELMQVPENYSILFIQGGASTQFSMVPLNFLQGRSVAAYLDAGFFSVRAIKEARFYGEPLIVASSSDRKYSCVPERYVIPPEAAYFHCTSNNTIEGTQMQVFPETDIPVVCDMSSDILSRRIEVENFDLIYAGAQKNMGPAGVTVVIARNSFLDSAHNNVPSMWDYRVYRQSDSLYNTAPVYSIYVMMLNLVWLKRQGGVDVIETVNKAKAEMLYQEIDRNSLFYGTADVECRSVMNVCFNMFDEKLVDDFLVFAEHRGMVGIKGYVTQFRVSLYNALPVSSVEMLVSTMQDFEKGVSKTEGRTAYAELA